MQKLIQNNSHKKTKQQKRDVLSVVEGISPTDLRNKRDTLHVIRQVLNSLTPKSNLYTSCQFKTLCNVVDRSFYEKASIPEFERYMGDVRRDNGHRIHLWGHPDTIADLKKEGILA